MVGFCGTERKGDIFKAGGGRNWGKRSPCPSLLPRLDWKALEGAVGKGMTGLDLLAWGSFRPQGPPPSKFHEEREQEVRKGCG